MMFPIVLGTGKRLFPEGISRATLQLNELRPVGPDGAVTLVYGPKH
jgi:hypothetical protein